MYREPLEFPAEAPLLARWCASVCNRVILLENIYHTWIWDNNTPGRTQVELTVAPTASILLAVKEDQRLAGLLAACYHRRRISQEDRQLIERNPELVRQLVVEQALIEQNKEYRGLTRIGRKCVDLSRKTLVVAACIPALVLLAILLLLLVVQEFLQSKKLV